MQQSDGNKPNNTIPKSNKKDTEIQDYNPTGTTGRGEGRGGGKGRRDGTGSGKGRGGGGHGGRRTKSNIITGHQGI
ncbi:MAG: hypothetical protein WBB19_11765 [Desulforhopalus sp.]